MSHADAPSTAVAVIDGQAELVQDQQPAASLALVPAGGQAPARQLSFEQAQRELAVLESDLPLLAQRIARHTEGYKWSVLEYGLRLLKAQEIHRRRQQQIRPRRHPHPPRVRPRVPESQPAMRPYEH